jgi:hypothetical protein
MGPTGPGTYVPIPVPWLPILSRNSNEGSQGYRNYIPARNIYGDQQLEREKGRKGRD